MFASTVTTSLMLLLAGAPGLLTAQDVTALTAAQTSGMGEQKDMRVHFGLNDAEITAEDRDRLAVAAKCLRANSNVRIELVGHADERGTSEFNLALGERRALSVKKYLEGLGVPGAQMKTLSLGEERPVAEASDEASWAQNRRVELFTPGGFNISASVCGAATVAEAQPKEAEQKPKEEAKP
ncbi:MAG: OmpA family protein, partial [Myxococcota bacterium]